MKVFAGVKTGVMNVVPLRGSIEEVGVTCAVLRVAARAKMRRGRRALESMVGRRGWRGSMRMDVPGKAGGGFFVFTPAEMRGRTRGGLEELDEWQCHS